VLYLPAICFSSDILWHRVGRLAAARHRTISCLLGPCAERLGQPVRSGI
jgi:hypothetical protein